MKIRAGYEISYDCSQPTPMILMLSVHPSRVADLLTPDRTRTAPALPANEYRDGFGNTCHVIHAPAGRLTLSSDFLIHGSGAACLGETPGRYPGVSARQPLLRDGPLHHHRVVDIRQCPEGMEAGAGD